MATLTPKGGMAAGLARARWLAGSRAVLAGPHSPQEEQLVDEVHFEFARQCCDPADDALDTKRRDFLFCVRIAQILYQK